MVNDASSISRSGYTQNPRLAEAAFEGVRKNTDFLKAADKAFKDVVATKAGDLKAGTKSGESAINTVGLKPPTDAAREKLSSEGQLTLLLGKLMTLLGDVSLSQLESRLAVWQAMIESQKGWGFRYRKNSRRLWERLRRRRISMKPASKRRIPPRVFMTLRPKN